MSDLFYKVVRAFGYPFIGVSSRATVLHRERAKRKGALLLAPTHMSVYDIPGLMRVTSRNLDFLSIVEFYEHPWTTRLFRRMNCIFCDRAKSDPAATRQILDRLRSGRVVTMFPEGHLRAEEKSVVNGGTFRLGVVRLAQLSGAPIMPCVILGTNQFKRVRAWAPIRLTRYGVAFGEPIFVSKNESPEAARNEATQRMKASYQALYAELNAALNRKPRTSGPGGADSPPSSVLTA